MHFIRMKKLTENFGGGYNYTVYLCHFWKHNIRCWYNQCRQQKTNL